MNINNFLISPVDLKLNQDWTKLVNAARHYISISRTHNLGVYPDTRPGGYSVKYELENCTVGHHTLSENWHLLYGDWAKEYLNWLPQLMEDTKELKPIWAISVAVGNCAEHVDWSACPSSLNYPINTTDAITYVRHEDQTYSYPSIFDQPWLLNTQYPHRIDNKEERLAFSLRFHTEYDVVKKWFDSNPGLVYG